MAVPVVDEGGVSGHQPGGGQSRGDHGRVLEPLPRRPGCVQGVQVRTDQTHLRLQTRGQQHHGEAHVRSPGL